MSDFYVDMPRYKEGEYKSGYSVVGWRHKNNYTNPKIYNNTQSAYLKARWITLWVDMFDFSYKGIQWYIIKIDKKKNN